MEHGTRSSVVTRFIPEHSADSRAHAGSMMVYYAWAGLAVMALALSLRTLVAAFMMLAGG